MAEYNSINPHALTSRSDTVIDGGKSAMAMWSELMNYVVGNDPEAKSNWKVTRSTSDSKSSACSACNVHQSSVLLKCSEVNCTARYHLPCGDKDHAICLKLTEDGKMTLLCKNHFKPYLFCSCQQPWEGDDDMTQCDTCCEWFHNSCAKLTTTVNTFICAKCSKCDRNDKEMVHKRARNELKDELWGKQNAVRMAAEDSITRLEEVESFVCPIINDWDRIKDLSSTSSSSYRGMNNPWRQHTIISLTQAMAVLNEPILGLNPEDKDSQGDSQGGSSQASSEMDVVEVGGEQVTARERLLNYPPLRALLTAFRDQIKQHLDLFLDWETREYNLAQKTVLPLFAAREFDKTKGLLRARTIGVKVQELLDELDGKICADEDADEFLVYRDAFKWYLSFLEKLHEERGTPGGDGKGVESGAAAGSGKSSSVAKGVSSDKDKDKTKDQIYDSDRDRDYDWLDELKECVKQASTFLSRIRKYDPCKSYVRKPAGSCEGMTAVFIECRNMAEKIVKELENWSDRVADSVLEHIEDDDTTDMEVEEESQVLALAPEVPVTVKTGRLSLSEAEDLANRASAFYVSPPLCRDLDRVIAKATTLERQISAALQQSTMTVAEYKNIQRHMQRMAVKLHPNTESHVSMAGGMMTCLDDYDRSILASTLSQDKEKSPEKDKSKGKSGRLSTDEDGVHNDDRMPMEDVEALFERVNKLIREARDNPKDAAGGASGGSSSRKSSSSSSAAAAAASSTPALPPLLDALLKRMETCRDRLTGLFEKTRPLAKQAETALQSNSANASAAASAKGSGGDVSETVLAALRLLPVITREERAAIFLEEVRKLLPQLVDATAVDATKPGRPGSPDAPPPMMPLEDAQHLLRHAEKLIGEQSADTFPVTKEWKGRLRSAHGSLKDDVSDAKGRWERVKTELVRGRGGIDRSLVEYETLLQDPHTVSVALSCSDDATFLYTAEAIMGLVDRAINTHFVHRQTWEDAQDAQSQAKALQSTVEKELPGIDGCSSEQVAEAFSLLLQTSRVPLPARLALDVRRHYGVVAVAAACNHHLQETTLHATTFLQEHDGVKDNAMKGKAAGGVSSSSEGNAVSRSKLEVEQLRSLGKFMDQLWKNLTQTSSVVSPNAAIDPLIALELRLLDPIVHPFRLLLWRIEVTHALKTRATLSTAQALLATVTGTTHQGDGGGAASGGSREPITTAFTQAAQASQDFATLRAAIIRAEETRQNVLASLTSLRQVKQASTEPFQKPDTNCGWDRAVPSNASSSFSLHAACQPALIASEEIWSTGTHALPTRLRALLQEEQEQAFGQPELRQELIRTLEQVDLVTQAVVAVAATRTIMLAGTPTTTATSASASASAGLPAGTPPAIAARGIYNPPPIEHVKTLDDLTILTNEITAAAAACGSGGAAGSAVAGGGGASGAESLPFQLLTELTNVLRLLHTEARGWEDQVKILLPPKTTRKSTKTEVTCTRRDLEDVLKQPVARAIRTPQYDKVVSTLCEHAAVEQDIIEFFVSSKLATEEDDNDDDDDADEETIFHQKVYDMQNVLFEIQNKCNLLPLDVQDWVKMVGWTEGALKWLINGVPLPTLTTEKTGDIHPPMAMRKARELLEQSSEMEKWPRWYVEELLRLGVLVGPSSSSSSSASGSKPSMCSLHSLPTARSSAADGSKKNSGGVGLDDTMVPCTGAPGYTCSSRFNTCLQRLGPLHAYLQQQVDLAVAFERKVADVLQTISSKDKSGAAASASNGSSTSQNRIPQLQEMYRSMGQLVVQPEHATRRALEKALGAHVPAPPEGQPRYSYADTDHDGECEDRASVNKKAKLTSGGKASSSSSSMSSGMSREEKLREQKALRLERDQLASVAPWGETKSGGKKRPLVTVTVSSGADKQPTKRPHIPTRRVACANPGCGDDVDSTDGAYCSDECAIKMAPELYRALLLARTQLCRALWSSKHVHRPPIAVDGIRASPQTLSLDSPRNDPSTVWGVSLADMQAMESRLIKPTQAMGEITGAMDRRQLITKTTKPLVAAETKESDSDHRQGDTEGLVLLQQLLYLEPLSDHAISGSGRASGGSLGGLSMNNESPSNTASTSPRSSSSSSSSAFFPSSSSSSTGPSVPGPGPLAFAPSNNPRELARMKFEEIFVASLTRTVTKEVSKTLIGQGQGLAAATETTTSTPSKRQSLSMTEVLSLGAIVALEMEADMYQWSLDSLDTGADKKSAREQYKKTQRFLVSNLKQPHNDPLILSLALLEKTPMQVLQMTPEDLADPALKIISAAWKKEAAAGSLQQQSLAEIREAHQKEVMTGNQEAWRSRDGGGGMGLTSSSSSSAGSGGLAHSPSRDKDNSSAMEGDYSPRLGLDDSNLGSGPPAALSEEAERERKRNQAKLARIQAREKEREKQAARPGKRPLNIDNVTRYTSVHGSTVKRAKGSHGPADAEAIGDGTVGHPSEHFPLKPLEASGSGVLEIFRASGRGKVVSFGGETEDGGVRFGDFEDTEDVDGEEDEYYDDENESEEDEETRARHQVSPLSSIPIRLLNTEGMIDFAVVYRDHPTGIVCTGVVSDKRVQGLLPRRLAINGRVQLPRVEEFINEVCDKGGSRFIATIRLFVQQTEEHAGLDSPYAAFCQEMVKDERAAICKIQRDGQDCIDLYLVPPQLKSSITALRHVSGQETDRFVLHGVVVSKIEGNDDFIQAIPDYVTEQEIAAMQLSDVGRGTQAVRSTAAAGTLSTSSGSSSSDGSSTTTSTATTTSSSSSSGGALPLASTAPPPPQPPHKPPPVTPTLASKPQSSAATMTGPSPGQAAVPPPPPPPSIPPPKSSSSSAAATAAAGGATVSAAANGTGAAASGAGAGAAPLSAEMMMSINKVANFCVSNGVKAMSMLKGKDKAREMMPFLFDDGQGYDTFIRVLREKVAEENAKATKP